MSLADAKAESVIDGKRDFLCWVMFAWTNGAMLLKMIGRTQEACLLFGFMLGLQTSLKLYEPSVKVMKGDEYCVLGLGCLGYVA